jgi:hypothetical protein
MMRFLVPILHLLEPFALRHWTWEPLGRPIILTEAVEVKREIAHFEAAATAGAFPVRRMSCTIGRKETEGDQAHEPRPAET